MRRLSIEWPTKGWFSLVVNDFFSLVSGVATCECDLKLTASHAGNSADVFIPLANFTYLHELSQRGSICCLQLLFSDHLHFDCGQESWNRVLMLIEGDGVVG